MSPIDWTGEPSDRPNPCLCGCDLRAVPTDDPNFDVWIEDGTDPPVVHRCFWRKDPYIRKHAPRRRQLRVVQGGKPAGSRHHIIGGRRGGRMP